MMAHFWRHVWRQVWHYLMPMPMPMPMPARDAKAPPPEWKPGRRRVGR
ncbi:hypothetical protein SALB_02256 [Streptomyces noursei]|uniref:Uncharacterized protein n=1 Tax=Streptomyces noursei TaxID=1971 RepID=A0A401QW77_STRNR|nr:hypothetical protein SALB_02256 [Streptomyces noursei]